MIAATGYAAKGSHSSLAPHSFERRDPGPADVAVQILYCGVCHSDLHQAQNEWGNTIYPCLPGHEIVGRVTATGRLVTRFKVGDTVGVGCLVDSCRGCASCVVGLEQYCEGPVGATLTYNGPMLPDGSNTFGGYSDKVVVAEHFVLKIPANLNLEAVPPLLCAGVTTYSPLKHWKVGPGRTVGVVGLGGLGHIAVKIAAALGAKVTVFSTSPGKEADARRLGAADFVLSTDAAAMKKHALGQDFVLSTVPESHDINPYVKLLKRDGTLCVVGALGAFAEPTDNSQAAFHRRSVAGSLIGGIAETQEVLDFCGRHNITADAEVIPITGINAAFKRMKKGDVRYRFVIDIANSLTPA